MKRDLFAMLGLMFIFVGIMFIYWPACLVIGGMLITFGAVWSVYQEGQNDG